MEGKKNINVAHQQNQIMWFQNYTPLTMAVSTVYTTMENLRIYNTLPRIRTPLHRRDEVRYYRYRHDTGHTIDDWQALKDEL